LEYGEKPKSQLPKKEITLRIRQLNTEEACRSVQGQEDDGSE